MLPCFVATRVGDLGWPRQQLCWAWLRMDLAVSTSRRLSEFGAEPPRTLQDGPCLWAAPKGPLGRRLRQLQGCRGFPRKGLEEVG